jgi:hypothetical protein
LYTSLLAELLGLSNAKGSFSYGSV